VARGERRPGDDVLERLGDVDGGLLGDAVLHWGRSDIGGQHLGGGAVARWWWHVVTDGLAEG